jgi:hypothetical protein
MPSLLEHRGQGPADIDFIVHDQNMRLWCHTVCPIGCASPTATGNIIVTVVPLPR